MGYLNRKETIHKTWKESYWFINYRNYMKLWIEGLSQIKLHRCF